MLEDEVIEAVEKNLFKIYAVKTIDEGIEILTGEKADTIDFLVQEKLNYYSRISKDYE